MQLKSVTFREGDEGAVPATATFELTFDEALYIAVIAGSHSQSSADAILSGGGQVNSAIYDSVVGDLFNRYYEDGVDDAKKDRP